MSSSTTRAAESRSSGGGGGGGGGGNTPVEATETEGTTGLAAGARSGGCTVFSGCTAFTDALTGIARALEAGSWGAGGGGPVHAIVSAVIPAIVDSSARIPVRIAQERCHDHSVVARGRRRIDERRHPHRVPVARWAEVR